jgi:pimeloyl-ACP methyl ester carboxylesterase
MSLPSHLLLLIPTTLYQLLACWLEDRQQPPPGQKVNIGGYDLHTYILGEPQQKPTIILEPSLGGIEGYLLAQELAKFARVVIYDRAGYGWSDSSPYRRTSQQIVSELDALLTQAKIQPPYLLIGNSFGSYNARLYAHQFPDKVVGLVLTDGLHEVGMRKMSLSLQFLKLFFASGFLMSAFGSAVGIVRLLGAIGVFELLKKELRYFPQDALKSVKRSFFRPKHWISMLREIWDLDLSSRQVQSADNFGDLPIVSIKSSTFFQRSLLNFYFPISAADRLRETMHAELLALSTDCTQIQAEQSGHFVWIDQPELILEAVQIVLQKAGFSPKM